MDTHAEKRKLEVTVMRDFIKLLRVHTMYLLAIGYVGTYMAAWLNHVHVTILYFMDGPESKGQALAYLLSTVFSPVGVAWSLFRWFS